MWYIYELNYLGVTVTVRVYTSVRPGRARRALPCYIFSEIRIFWRGLGRSPNKSSMVYGSAVRLSSGLSSVRVGQGLVVLG